jgi:hypothetical protein
MVSASEPEAEERSMFDFEKVHATIATLRAKQHFFVGGAIKSGTTWLQILLDAHPEVSCGGEGHMPDRLAPLLQQALDKHSQYIAGKNESIFSELPGYPTLADEDSLYLFASAITLLLLRQAGSKYAQAVGERTPDNIRHFGLLHRLFPLAKFIHIVRDGRDSAVSGWYHNLRTTPDWVGKRYPSFDAYAARFAEIWAVEVGEGVKFAAAVPDLCLTIRFEDLSASPINTLRDAFGFLGVRTDDATVEACCAKGAFEQLSGGRSPGQENRNSLFRKGVAGEWRSHFSKKTNRTFLDKSGGLLTKFGYC